MVEEILAMLSVPLLAICGFLVAKCDDKRREDKAYREGYSHGYEDGQQASKIVNFRNVR